MALRKQVMTAKLLSAADGAAGTCRERKVVVHEPLPGRCRQRAGAGRAEAPARVGSDGGQETNCTRFCAIQAHAKHEQQVRHQVADTVTVTCCCLALYVMIRDLCRNVISL